MHAATFTHRVETDHRFECAHENRLGHVHVSDDHVQAVVEAVDQVHVRPSARGIHGLVPGRPAAARGVGSEVGGAPVGLDFDDASCGGSTVGHGSEDDAEQIAGHLQHGPLEEASRQGAPDLGRTQCCSAL